MCHVHRVVQVPAAETAAQVQTIGLAAAEAAQVQAIALAAAEAAQVQAIVQAAAEAAVQAAVAVLALADDVKHIGILKKTNRNKTLL